MKKIAWAVLILMIVSVAAVSLSEADVWTCPQCGNEAATGNFCSMCGTKKPVQTADDTWICSACGHEAQGRFCSECGTPRQEQNEEMLSNDLWNVGFVINFKQNLFMATYDVDMYIDSQFIATLPHGRDYAGSIQLESGSHMFDFFEHGDRDVRGSLRFDVNGDTKIEFDLEAKTLRIEIDDVKKSGTGEVSSRLSGSQANVSLSLDIRCEKNAVFSKYDVDVYLDGNYIGTIAHGKSMVQTINNITVGKHIITFYSAKDASVAGSLSVDITKATKLSCEIHCKNDKIKVDHIKQER